jgi:hypothetical protein
MFVQGDIKKSVAEDTESSRQLQEWNAKYGEGAKGSARPAIGFAAIPRNAHQPRAAPRPAVAMSSEQ